MMLQTPPDTAASNAALWIKKFTGYLPDLPPWADALGTVIGVLLIVVPIALWVRKKWWRKGKSLPSATPGDGSAAIHIEGGEGHKVEGADITGGGYKTGFRVIGGKHSEFRNIRVSGRPQTDDKAD